MSRHVFEKIKKLLDESHVKYNLLEHEPVYTSEEAACMREKLTGQPAKEIMECGAKAMIVKADGAYYQLILAAVRKIDFDKVRAVLGVKKVGLASRDDVVALTDCVPGSVPPFGILFGLSILVDQSLLQQREIYFNAGELTISIMMALDDWMRIVKPRVVEFSV